MYVDVDDVVAHDVEIADGMKENSRRYANLFAEAVDELIPTYLNGQKVILRFNVLQVYKTLITLFDVRVAFKIVYLVLFQPPVKDALDAFIYQRLLLEEQAQRQQGADNAATADPRKSYPPELMRRL